MFKANVKLVMFEC